MKLFLPYHHKKIEVSLSPKNLASVIMPQEVSPIPDVPQAITIALDESRDQYSFDRFAQRGVGLPRFSQPKTISVRTVNGSVGRVALSA